MKINKSKGMTMVELLLAIAISGMILIGVSSLINALFSSNTRSTEMDQLEQTKNDLIAEITNNVRWAKTVTILPSTIVVVSEQGNPPIDVTTNYSLDSNRIKKNNDFLTSSTVKITEFKITDRSQNPDIKSLDVSIKMQHADATTIENDFRFVVSQRVPEIDVSN